MELVELGVDGDSAYALLGPELQEGESEWVKIRSQALCGSEQWQNDARAAATAYYKLWEQLPERHLRYELVGPIALPRPS